MSNLSNFLCSFAGQTRMPSMMQQLKPLLKRKNRPISNVANRLAKDIVDTRQRLDFYLLGPGHGK